MADVSIIPAENISLTLDNSDQSIELTIEDDTGDISLVVSDSEFISLDIAATEVIDLTLENAQGPSGPPGEQVYVQDAQPSFQAGVPSLWIQTNINTNGDHTFWFFDGNL